MEAISSLTTNELAELLGLHPSGLRRLVDGMSCQRSPGRKVPHRFDEGAATAAWTGRMLHNRNGWRLSWAGNVTRALSTCSAASLNAAIEAGRKYLIVVNGNPCPWLLSSPNVIDEQLLAEAVRAAEAANILLDVRAVDVAKSRHELRRAVARMRRKQRAEEQPAPAA